MPLVYYPVYPLWVYHCLAIGSEDQGRSTLPHDYHLPLCRFRDCHRCGLALADAADDGHQPALCPNRVGKFSTDVEYASPIWHVCRDDRHLLQFTGYATWHFILPVCAAFPRYSRSRGDRWRWYLRHLPLCDHPVVLPVTFTAIVLTGMNSILFFMSGLRLSGSGPAFATDTLAFFMFQSTFGAYRY